MNKTLKYCLITLGFLGGLWIFGRVTNIIQWYSTATPSNYPTLKVGDHLFATNLIKPKKFDLICYKSITPEFGKGIWVHRLCGLEGDTIEIKKGDLYVNNEFVDNMFSIAHEYIISTDELEKLKNIEEINELFRANYSKDSTIIQISAETIKKYSLNAVKHILPKDYFDEYITNKYSANWNLDNFGPFIVPKGKYFVLGDNRKNSLDSRYNGCIDKSDYVATVIR